MSFTAFVLILISVFLHAGWNFLSKTNRPSAAFFLFINAVPAVLLLPILLSAEIPWGSLGIKFWLCAAASIFFEVLYALGLFHAYKKNDISTVYPLARAIPVLLVAAVTVIFGIGKMPTSLAIAGFAVVTVGCVILPQPSFAGFGWRCFADPVLLPILIAGIATTGYTIMDSMAVGMLGSRSPWKTVMTASAYYCLIEIGTSLGLLALVLSSKHEIVEFRRKCFASPYPYLCGVFSCAAYLLVLTAMNFVTNVSYLQAFRQMSLPLGVAAGFWILHEKITMTKVVGICLVVTGLVLTVL